MAVAVRVGRVVSCIILALIRLGLLLVFREASSAMTAVGPPVVGLNERPRVLGEFFADGVALAMGHLATNILRGINAEFVWRA